MSTNDACQTSNPTASCCSTGASAADTPQHPARRGATTGSTIVLHVDGMTCGSCERQVGQALAAVPGVIEVAVARANSSATVVWTNAVPDVSALIDAVESSGYDARVAHVEQGRAAVAAEPSAAHRCGCCEEGP